MEPEKRIYPSETHELCFALKDAGYQSDVTDPKSWNDSLTQEQLGKGYLWHEHPQLGWYPDPGREALCEEIIKLIGQDRFDTLYGKDEINNISRLMSHEAWMREWLKHKAANHD